MKRLIATLFLTLAASIPALAATSWFNVSQDLNQSVYRLSVGVEGSELGTCSGFVIDQRVSNMLTVAHCVPEGFKVSILDTTADVLYKDDTNDLAVIRFPGRVLGQSLHPGKKAKTGDATLTAGYPWGWLRPVFIIGTVAQEAQLFEGIEHTVTTPGAAPGMSGGPVVNAAGKVVSIVQAGAGSISIGVDIDVIRKSTKKYWQFDR